MGIGSGLSTQLMLAEEGTVGTAVTVTRGYEVEDVKPTHQRINKTSMGLRAGAFGHRERNRATVGRAPTLQLPMSVFSKGFGVFFKHALGANSTAQIGVSLTYRQINTPGSLTGKGLTVQYGLADTYTGTVRPYTLNGSKVTDWELACQMDDILKLNLGLDAWNWTTATALAAASYLTGLEVFNFAQLTTTVGGTLAISSGRTTVSGGTAIKGLRGVSLKGKNNLRVDRRVAGSAGIKIEQLENGFREFTADLDLEYADRTQIFDVADGETSTPLQFTWTGATDDGSGNKPVVRVTYPTARFEDASPQTNSADIVDGKITATAYEDNAGTYPLLQIEYESQDTTP